MDQSKLAKNHVKHFNDMNELNSNVVDILSSVCTFKVDLARILERVIECYSSIFLQQYQTFHEMHFAKEKRVEDEVEVLRQKQAELDEEKKMTL